MLKFVGKRLLQLLPVLFGATFIVFFLVYSLPGDPVATLGGDKALPQATIDLIKHEHNLDQPFIVQYLLFLKGVFTMDLGSTIQKPEPIAHILARCYPVTIQLAIMAFLFEALFGVIIGVVAGLKKGKIFDSTALVLSLLLIAVPTFVLGFVYQFVFGVSLRVLPATASSHPGFLDLLMPAMVLAGVSLAYVMRLTRTSVIENMNADYVRTATAKGLTFRDVTVKHVLRNSLIPVVTFLGTDLGALMAGAIVTERVFNVKGIGNELYSAVSRQESTEVVAIVTLLILVFIISNLIVDMLYALLDPRIRYNTKL
jgi:oligopeptide transport system permease protein